jgi:hypothetical protein
MTGSQGHTIYKHTETPPQVALSGLPSSHTSVFDVVLIGVRDAVQPKHTILWPDTTAEYAASCGTEWKLQGSSNELYRCELWVAGVCMCASARMYELSSSR